MYEHAYRYEEDYRGRPIFEVTTNEDGDVTINFVQDSPLLLLKDWEARQLMNALVEAIGPTTPFGQGITPQSFKCAPDHVDESGGIRDATKGGE